jgi:TPR repeat protein
MIRKDKINLIEMSEIENPEDLKNLGLLYLGLDADGLPLPFNEYPAMDIEKAVSYLEKAAASGDVHAQRVLGDIYYEGKEVTTDYIMAFKWYKKAAMKRGPHRDHSYIRLGDMHFFGRGVSRDYDESASNYKQVATENILKKETKERQNIVIEACAKLGKIYLFKEDYSEAAKWFTEAADYGDSEAAYWLGLLFEEGKGVPKNMKQALEYYMSSAEGGDDDAQNKLGDVYECNNVSLYGVEKNYKKAAMWFERAAHQGNKIAQYNIARLYESGLGVIQNYIKAYAYYCLSSAQGITEAAKVRDVLAKKMTRAQIAEAQKLAEELESS